jgi:hypothetical protein
VFGCLVRFPDSIALELMTNAHQGSDCALGFREENGGAFYVQKYDKARNI